MTPPHTDGKDGLKIFLPTKRARVRSAVASAIKCAWDPNIPRTSVRGVLEHDVHSFGVYLNSHEHLFGVEPPSQTCTGRSPLASRRRRSECRGRDAKCAGNAPFSSRSGRIASGITWRRRRGAVLGSPHARAPKVSPKMVGPLLRGNERGPRRKYFRWGKLGGNPQEGGNNTSLSRDVTPPKLNKIEPHAHLFVVFKHALNKFTSYSGWLNGVYVTATW